MHTVGKFVGANFRRKQRESSELFKGIVCHAISTDCLLIEAACTHALKEHRAWWMADKFVCTFKSSR